MINMGLIDNIISSVSGETNSPVEQVAQAVEATKINPSSDQIIADIKTALDLFVQFKASVGVLHPSAWAVIKFLL